MLAPCFYSQKLGGFAASMIAQLSGYSRMPATVIPSKTKGNQYGIMDEFQYAISETIETPTILI
jgi:hypothetical protein